jgi:rhamnose transport system permease protein
VTVQTPAAPATGRVYRDYAHPLLRRILVTREMAIVALVVVVAVVAVIALPRYAGPLTLPYLLLDIAAILMIALPMTLIIITGEIDLSVASTLALASVTFGGLHEAGLPIEAAGLVALVVGVLAGAVNGFFVTVVGLPSLAVTIATLALYRGIAVGLLGTRAVTEFGEFWTDLATSRIPGTPIPSVTILVAALAVGFAILLHFTAFGRGVYAVGQSKEAARFSGVRVERTKFILFVLAGAVSALAGLYYTLRFGNARGQIAEGLELSVIAAVLLGGVSIFGGRGAIHGVIAGVVLIGLLGSALRFAGVTSDVINIITGALLVVSVVTTSILAWIHRWRTGRGVKKGPPAV